MRGGLGWWSTGGSWLGEGPGCHRAGWSGRRRWSDGGWDGVGRRSGRGSGDGGIRARGAPRLSHWGGWVTVTSSSGSLWSIGGSASGSRSRFGSGVVWLGNAAGGWGAVGSVVSVGRPRSCGGSTVVGSGGSW